MVETYEMRLRVRQRASALNEATIFRWWKLDLWGVEGLGAPGPSMKPPSFDGGNVAGLGTAAVASFIPQ